MDFKFHWIYQTFRVTGASDKDLPLEGKYIGSAGNDDAMAYSNNHQFTTGTMMIINMEIVHW